MAEVISTSLFNDPNLQAYYRFGAGALLTDSKNSNTLTNNGGVAEGTGKWGGGADFGSSNTSKSVSVGINLGANWGVGFWVKQAAERTSGQVQGIGITVSNSVYPENLLVYDNSGGTFRIGIGQHVPGAYLNFAYTNLGSGIGTTHNHIVWTRTGTVTDVYLNGVLTATRTYSTAGGSANYVILGRSAFDGGSWWLSGSIDDAPLFNRGLTAADALKMYRDASGGQFLTNFL